MVAVMVAAIGAWLTAAAQTGLKDAVGAECLMGVAVNARQCAGLDTAATRIIREHFNSLVAENCMKAGALQPREGVFNFAEADRFVDYAEANGAVPIGHCLVWHSQAATWMFTDSLGRPATRELLVERMRRHIHAVVGHYRGRVRGWDVVNEAFNDDGTLRQSPWSEIIGPDFIELAFRFAHEADPAAELYYNDYSMSAPGRRDAVCRLVRQLKAKGLRIDAVGMQSHNGLYWPDLELYEAAMDSLAACGVKVMISELDLNMLPAPKGFGGAEVSLDFDYGKELDPFRDGLTEEMERQLEQRWMELFGIFHRHRHQISRICLWGVSDGDSWLNNWPVRGRTAYPLLFDRQHRARPVVERIVELYRQ